MNELFRKNLAELERKQAERDKLTRFANRWFPNNQRVHFTGRGWDLLGSISDFSSTHNELTVVGYDPYQSGFVTSTPIGLESFDIARRFLSIHYDAKRFNKESAIKFALGRSNEITLTPIYLDGLVMASVSQSFKALADIFKEENPSQILSDLDRKKCAPFGYTEKYMLQAMCAGSGKGYTYINLKVFETDADFHKINAYLSSRADERRHEMLPNNSKLEFRGFRIFPLFEGLNISDKSCLEGILE